MPEPEQKNGSSGNTWRQIGRYSNLAFVLPGAVLGGLLLGALLDHWLKTSWLTLVGLLLGCVAGFIELIRGVIKAGKDA